MTSSFPLSAWPVATACCRRHSPGETMTELQFADDILARIRAKVGFERTRLPVRAGEHRVRAVALAVRRHISGPEPRLGLSRPGARAFGLLARPVLGTGATHAHGGLRPHRLHTSSRSGCWYAPGDSEEDFRDVFEFESAFDESYAWEGVRRVGADAAQRRRQARQIEGPMDTRDWPECLKCNARYAHPPLRLRPRRRANHLQSLGLHQPRLRFNLRIDNGEISFGGYRQSHNEDCVNGEQ